MEKPKLKLQLSNGYYLRFEHLSKLLDYVANERKSASFGNQELSNALGMSSRMIENLTSYSVAIGILFRRTYKPTEFGSLINKEDAFFDKIETLWFLHYNISSTKKYIVWNRLVNRVFFDESKVSTEKARKYFNDLNGYFSEKSINKHLAKEIQSFFNAYTEQKLNQLKFIKKISNTKYQLNDSIQVPDICVLASCYLYRDRHKSGATGLEIDQLVKEENSPGRVFHIPENKFRLILERLNAKRMISIESRANLDQIRFDSNKNWIDIMKQFY